MRGAKGAKDAKDSKDAKDAEMLSALRMLRCLEYERQVGWGRRWVGTHVRKGTRVGEDSLIDDAVRRPSWDTVVLNLGPAGAVLCVLRVRFL